MSMLKTFAKGPFSKRVRSDRLPSKDKVDRLSKASANLLRLAKVDGGVAKSSAGRHEGANTSEKTPSSRGDVTKSKVGCRPFSYTLSVEDALRALALTLCKDQPAGLKKETAVFDLTCDIRAVDRLLLLSGWQGRSFLCTQNVCFVHMVMCHARYLISIRLPQARAEAGVSLGSDENVDSDGDAKKSPLKDLRGDQLRQLLQIVLYVSYCYAGSETGYPVWPFRPYHWALNDFHELAFWLAAALSRPMLDYNRTSDWQKVYHDDLLRIFTEDAEMKARKKLEQERDAVQETRTTSLGGRSRRFDSFSSDQTNDSGAFSDSDSADSVNI